VSDPDSTFTMTCKELRAALAEVDGRLKAMEARAQKLARELEDAQNALAEKDAEIERLKEQRLDLCQGCAKPLVPENYQLADGCPCNSRRGINHGLVPASVCTCKECDPAETGSSRFRPDIALDASVARERTLRELLSRASGFRDAHSKTCARWAARGDYEADCNCGVFAALSAPADTSALEAVCLRVALLAIELRRGWADGKKSPHECAQRAVRSVLGLPEKEER
jgi:hypothetical protein